MLYGTDFWAPLIDWFRNTLVTEGTISASDLDLFSVTDSAEEAVDTIFDFYEGVDPGALLHGADPTLDL